MTENAHSTSGTERWWKFRMTAPPKVGYIQSKSKDDAHAMMESHPYFVGYHNGANTVSLSPLKDEYATESKIRELIQGATHPNEAVTSDGTRLVGTYPEVSEYEYEWTVDTETQRRGSSESA